MLRAADVDPEAVNEPSVVAAIVAAFERYEAALPANDLEALDELMWDD